MTRRAGVVGFPIGHSLSPLIHRAWIDGLGLDADYQAIEVKAGDFADFVARHRRGARLAGVNVTIPHKEAALALADVVEPIAAQARAANLLLFRPDGLIEARNTDGIGLLEAFHVQAPGFDITAAPVLLLGAGGAARGAVAALAAAGVKDIRIVNRTIERAQAIAADFPQCARAWDQSAPSDAAPAGCVINSTSLGLNGGDGPAVVWSAVRPDAPVMDMVYKPLQTAFLRAAAAAGRPTVDGLEMLIRQAVPSFGALYGVHPPLDRVDARALALAALGETA